MYAGDLFLMTVIKLREPRIRSGNGRKLMKASVSTMGKKEVTNKKQKSCSFNKNLRVIFKRYIYGILIA